MSLFTIIITNFRGVKESKYSFDTGITLLKGVSASGKTTIFSAFEWCLFGKAKNVVPIDNKSAKTSVIIDIRGVIITRRKHPSILTIKIDDEIYKDDEAQSIIDSIFGDRDKFFILSYIEQKKYTKFLDLKNNERLEFLNKLSFEEETVKKFKADIENQLKVIENELKNCELLLRYENSKLKGFDIEKIIDISDTNLSEVEARLLKDKQYLKQLLEKKSSLLSESNLSKQLQEQIALKEKYTSTLLLISEQEYDNYIEEANRLQKVKKQLQYKNDITNKLSMLKDKFNKIFTIYDGLTEEDIESSEYYSKETIDKTRYIENKLRDNFKIYKELKLRKEDITIEYVDKLKNQLRLEIEQSKRKLEYDQYINLVNKKKYELSKLPDIDYDEEINKINQAIISSSCYNCPKCQELLLFKENKLQLIENKNLVVDKIDRTKIKQLESQKQLRNKLIIEISTIEQTRGISFTEIPISNYNLSELQTRYDRIQKIEILDEVDITSEMMIHFNEMKKLRSEIKLFEKEVDSIDCNDSISDVTTTLNFYREKIRQQDDNRIKFNETQKYIVEIRNRLSKLKLNYKDEIEKVNNNIALTENRIISNEKLIEKIKISIDYNKVKQDMSELENNIKSLNDNIVSLDKLKKNTNLLECRYLDKTIKSVNNCLNDFLSQLNFKYTILLKSVESNSKSGSIRTGVFVKILSNGNELSDISMLSGGEVDRLSFALSLSFSHLFEGLFLVFDEIFSSLGIEMRKECIDLMKVLKMNAIIISHEEVEGYYEGKVIDISES